MFTRALGLMAMTMGTAMAQEGSLRVTGGAPAADGVWPDAVGIVFGGQYIGCTGTLIAPDVVITAAHCVGGISHVWVGSTNARFWNDDEGELIRVSSQTAHPTYSRQGGADIAVLTLQEESSFRPRAIASGCVLDDYLYDGAPVAVVGFGTIDAWGNQDTDVLMEGFTEVTDDDCSATFRGCEPSISPGGEIGAGGANNDGVDACYGDSGGPLYLLTEVGDYVVGVTSRAFYDVNVPCGEGGIWTRPDAFMDWIEDTARITLEEPTCNFRPIVESDLLTVPQGKSRNGSLPVDDPEGSDLEVVRVVQEPEHGVLDIDPDGSYTYTADSDYLGSDGFAVEVQDTEGYPLQAVTAWVDVQVVEDKGFLGCGACATPVGAVGSVWLLALFGMRRRQD